MKLKHYIYTSYKYCFNIYFLVSRRKKKACICLLTRGAKPIIFCWIHENLYQYIFTHSVIPFLTFNIWLQIMAAPPLEKQFTSKSKNFYPVCKNLFKVKKIYLRQKLLQFIPLPLCRFSHNAYLQYGSGLPNWDKSDKILKQIIFNFKGRRTYHLTCNQ